MSSLAQISSQDIEDVVNSFRDSSEETGKEKFLTIANATADYFGAYGDTKIKSYKDLIRFVQQNAKRNPLVETYGQDFTIDDFYAHIEGLKRVFRRENRSWLLNSIKNSQINSAP